MLELPIENSKPILPNLEIFNKNLNDLIKSGVFANNGEFHKLLSNKLKIFLKVENTVLTSSCTSSIRSILAIHNFDENKREIIVPSFTFVATVSSIVASGYIPKFVDVLINDGTIDPRQVEKAISKNTFAILGVHSYGNPCSNNILQEIAERYNVKLFYDAAHAFGVTKNNESILNWGDASALSFHATKVFNTCEGGAIVSKNSHIINNSNTYINHGIDTQEEEKSIKTLGMNAKLSELNAAFGLAVIDKVNISISIRKKIYKKYLESFSMIHELFKPFLNICECNHNFAYAPFIVKNKNKRDELINFLKSHEIISKKYFYPLVSDMKPYLKYQPNKMLENSLEISNRVICLPIHPLITEEQLEYIIIKVKNFFKY